MFLLVGDVHAKKSNLEETQKLLGWIEKTAVEKAKDVPIQLLFLGDQFNDFGVARVEVVQLWAEFIEKMKQYKNITLVFLVGNHDYNSDCTATAMSALVSKNSVVVDAPMSWQLLKPPVILLPYMKNNDEFVEVVNKMTENLDFAIVFCHQEFNGAQFENGFYAPHGVDLDLIKNKKIQIVSGHIHKHQKFDRVWYPGTPRHLTRSDAGEQKGIWLYDGNVEQATFIPTPTDVCLPYVSVKIQEGDNEDQPIPQVGKIYIDIYGTSSFVKKMLEKVPDHASVRTFVQDTLIKDSQVRESDGISKAYAKWVKRYAFEKKIEEEILNRALMKVSSLCPILSGGQDERRQG